MNSRARFFALWFLSALAALVLNMKGRGFSSIEGGSPASLFSGANAVRVKVTGVQDKGGVYCLPEGSSLWSVIIMAPHGIRGESAKHLGSTHRLKDGDWVVFESIGSEPAGISVKKMSVAEMMLLGVPLDPAIMTESDWERLPGIGPALARRIVLDRQYNGAFRSVRDLERISGIGRVTVNRIERYF